MERFVSKARHFTLALIVLAVILLLPRLGLLGESALPSAAQALGGGPYPLPTTAGPSATPTITLTPSPTSAPGIALRVSIDSANLERDDIVELALRSVPAQWWSAYDLGDHVGVSGMITFDPRYLMIVDAAGAPSTQISPFPDCECEPLTTQYRVNNATGQITFYLSAYHGEWGPGGFIIATLRVRALRPVARTELRLSNIAALRTAAPWPAENTVTVNGVVSITGATDTPTPTRTATPTTTATPMSTPTSAMFMAHGVVTDPSGQPASGASVSLQRHVGDAWQTKSSAVTLTDGIFRLWASGVPGAYRLVMEPPAGTVPGSASLPPGVPGNIVAPDVIEFTVASGATSLGAFGFALAHEPTPTLTPSATPTGTPVPTIPPPPVSLQGYIWADANGDGLRQDSEGYPSVQVTASGQGVTQTTTSGVAGYYAIRGLAPGAYILTTYDPLGRLPRSSRPAAVGDDPLKPGVADWRWWHVWLAQAAYRR